MRKITTLGVLALSSISLLVNAAEDPKIKKTITTSAPVKLSKPLRELAKPLPTLDPARKFKLSASGDNVPGFKGDREIPNRFPEKDRDYSLPEGFVDKSAQTSMPVRKKSAELLMPEIGVNFNGLPNVTGSVPPDTNGDVGPNHYVQTVNVALGIWDKEGNVLVAPTAINALWDGFGGLCETNNNGDPIVLYDSAADRWLISQFAFESGFNNNRQCIAISQTGDPTGAYYLYDFLYADTIFNDYPKFGVWTDGYYMGVNQFDPNFAGGGVVAYERDAMLVGAEARQIKFDMSAEGSAVFTPMPLDIDGLIPPPAGAKQYFIWADLVSTDNLQVWEFDANWSDPGASTFERVLSIPVTPYGSAPNVTQPNGNQLDSISIRSMFRAAYRNLDGQGKIVFNHNIAAPTGQGETAMRWYEIDVDQLAGTATIAQEGTFAPDTHSRWMGSGAMDVNGNLAFGYSIASPDLAPGIRAATRLATDAANTLTEEIVLQAGEGSQAGATRWGDYSSMSIDPTDDCTFWFSTEYYESANDGSTAWSTKITSFKLPSCVAGPRGEIAGTVTDADSGEVIPFARVSAGLISTRADLDGNYILTLPVGDYDLTASKYGWVESTPASVTVNEDETTDSNITLTGATPVIVSGTVSDANRTDAPLYAKITVSVPDDTFTTFSNPETGEYSISLFEGTTVGFSAAEVGVGGYMTSSQDVLPVNETQQRLQGGVDFALDANANCTAPGYDFVLPSFLEAFDVFPATGWSVVDDQGSGAVWGSYLASGRNLPGIDGDAAFIDSDAAGLVDIDTSLVSPRINVADISTTTLQFDAFFRTFTGADSLDVDINVDGAGWVNVGTVAANNTLEAYAIDLSAQLSGATSFEVRFRYYDANFEWYALVDNVRFGDLSCAPLIAGNLRSGYVIDTNTGEPLVGAEVDVDDRLAAMSFATPEDDAVNDGLFQVFVPADATAITVEEDNYETATPAEGDITLATPVSLNAGQLESDSETVEVTQTAGRTATDSITITNSGSAAASFNSYFIKGDATAAAQINGPFHPSSRHFGPKNMNDRDTRKIRYQSEVNVDPLAPGDIVGFFPTNITYGWGISTNRATGEFYVGDLEAAGAPANVIWRYEADGTLTSDFIPVALDGSFFADSAFNQRTGKLWQVDVGDDDCIHEYDVDALAATGNKICPAFGASQRGLAYDPVTDTFYSGSWVDSIIHQFTADGTILRSVNVGLSIAGLAYNAETQHLFISVNGESVAGAFDVVVVDAASPSFVKVGGYDVRLDVDGDGVADDVVQDFGQAGLDIDCNGNLWMVEQQQQFVIGFESGETGACEWNNVPWLTASVAAGDLSVGATSDVDLTMDSTGLNEGTYTASIVYGNDTPYGAVSVPVSMTLTAPQYGTSQISVTGITVDEEDTATITLERTGGDDYEVSVDFTTIDGTAVAGTDYTAASGTVTWGDLDSATKTITVSTNALDVNKSFTVVISNPQGGVTLGAKTAASVTIMDKPKGSGSIGIPVLLLFALAGFARRRSLNK
ncbi:PKD domain-containing protein [Aliikangiella marina]|uniref:PKD domain-containing protein n=1 Tax=Aliikangiella marina TaxID=1712262 RepID=A0A545TA12_9GAMM|nr:carboxypeptidase regulatory-like domain-containing protein [Aliikangiella marina]TQV74048.1 PKD domain-containing protein [Aliikangiella marina]